MLTRRLMECAAMMMVGDGALALLDAQRHTELWDSGLRVWRGMVRPFVRNPTLTRVAGAAGVIAGLWLAQRQRPDWSWRRA